jgi:hypothetical protein
MEPSDSVKDLRLADEKAEETRKKLYETQCLKYQDGSHSAIQEFDRSLLTLSAGALGVSLGFIKDVVPLKQAICLSLLFGSWYCFGISILLTLVSFIASQKAFRHMQAVAYEYYILGHEDAPTKRGAAVLTTRYLTYASGCFFLVALVLTLTFVTWSVVNIRDTFKSSPATTGGTMENKAIQSTTGSRVRIEKGVEPSGLIRVPPPQPQSAPPTQPPAGQSDKKS